VDLLLVELTKVVMSIVMFEADAITNDIKTRGSFIKTNALLKRGGAT